MIHELRTYHCLPGRLSDVVARFRDITLSLFDRHGIRPLHFWTVVVGPSSTDLIYVLEWDSLADRDKRWNAFAGDPDWIEARAQSERDGQLIASGSNMLLQPVLVPGDEVTSLNPLSTTARETRLADLGQRE
jgi:hypothetical protein